MPTLSLNIQHSEIASADFATSGELQKSLMNASRLLQGMAVGAYTGASF